MGSRVWRAACAALLALLPTGAGAEWTNRYPKVANTSHHVYLEGFNLPTLAAGPTDPAPSPDGRSIAFAARGWLWIMDLQTREARRITRGGAVDARPAWSPDGRQLAFMRDDGADTALMVLDLANGRERVLVDTPAMDVDPAFAPDGRSLFYSSAQAGDFDLWRLDLASGQSTRLTTARGMELQPQPLADGAGVLFIAKVGGSLDSVERLDLKSGQASKLHEEGIASQMRAYPSPDGDSYVVNVPVQGRWQLLLRDVKGGPAVRLAPDMTYALQPSWAADGAHVWFVQPDADARFRLYRLRTAGGRPEEMTPVRFDLGQPTARLTLRTRLAGREGTAPARVSVTDGQGHPALFPSGLARFDGQHGRVFFYSPGAITVEVPAGPVRIHASHGFEGAREITRTLRAGESATLDLEIPSSGWAAANRGWVSADLHSHLNYGGPYRLAPDDLVADMRGEDLDLSTPQIANLHTNIIDEEWFGWRRVERPAIYFAQEVRSHFLGHVAVLGADALYAPAFYGPGYPVYADLDLANARALRFARERGGMNVYVHPVSVREPFPATGDPTGLPLELVPDALDGEVDTLEIACLWSDELGTSAAWYRLLNLGLPIQPSAGSDTMHNFHRTMAIGSARIYAKPDGGTNLRSYLEAVKRGRSFVSTGPQLDFQIAGAGPGGVATTPGGELDFSLDVWSPTAVETVEILVNGEVAWRSAGLSAPGQRRYAARVKVPSGGWVAARVHGGPSRWPVQDSYPFAHTAPVWLNAVGSREPAAARAAAKDLLRWMAVAEKRLADNYPGDSGRELKARFAKARQRLEAEAGA